MKQTNYPSISYSKRNNKEKGLLNHFLLKNQIQFQPTNNPHKDYEAVVQILLPHTQSQTFSENKFQNIKTKNAEKKKPSHPFQEGLNNLENKKHQTKVNNSNQLVTPRKSKPENEKVIIDHSKQSSLNYKHLENGDEILKSSNPKCLNENNHVDKETFEKLLTLISMNKNPKGKQTNEKHGSESQKENINEEKQIEQGKKMSNKSVDLRKSPTLGDLTPLEKEFQVEKSKVIVANQKMLNWQKEESLSQSTLSLIEDSLEKKEDLSDEKLSKNNQSKLNQSITEEKIEELISQNLLKISFDKFSLLEQNEALPYFGKESNKVNIEKTQSKIIDNPPHSQPNQQNLCSIKGQLVNENENKEPAKNSLDVFDSFDLEEFQRLQTQFEQKTSEFEDESFLPSSKQSQKNYHQYENSIQQNELSFLLNSLSSKVVQTLSSNLPTQENEDLLYAYPQLLSQKEGMIRSKSTQLIQKQSSKTVIQNFHRTLQTSTSRSRSPNKKQNSNLKDSQMQGIERLKTSKLTPQSKSTTHLHKKNSNNSSSNNLRTPQKQKTSEQIQKSPVKISFSQKSSRIACQNTPKINKSPFPELNKTKLLSESKGFMSSTDAVKHYQLLIKKATYVPIPTPKIEPKKVLPNKEH